MYFQEGEKAGEDKIQSGHPLPVGASKGLKDVVVLGGETSISKCPETGEENWSEETDLKTIWTVGAQFCV